jgi:NAD(P)-dependent dehydrogenase (short-subunit alcohol dehydrogenase family)
LREAHGARVDIRQFDITDRQAVADALADVGEIDIAILNAGTCEYVEVDHFDPAMFERVFAANFFGAVYCTEALLPKLSREARLVYIDSLARLLPFTRSQAYGASKAALHYFARTMEVDLKPRGIRVFTASPGFIDTPLTRKNNFTMPMLIDAETAAEGIIGGIACGHRNIYVPWHFAAMLRLLGALPEGVQVWLSSKMKGSQ